MKFSTILSHSVFVMILGLPMPSLATQLIVVADLGGESTAAYFAGVSSQYPLSQSVTPEDDMSSLSIASSKITAMLPVSTPELTPGHVDTKTRHLPGMIPIFLIGDDELSRRWLQMRLNLLVQLNALGLVVNVSSESGLNELSKQANGLKLLPVSGSDLAKRLGLSHYPVLLTENGIEQ